eukprot:gnl/TRDRNA2_/TRDRNA2_133489_c1_seq1.p1 gnl/TRDRNA2_/TRDRNA2_133489_c1~~gnl/TRDRNA2_/TRDRNA2_133489_c1_seq1.p1  ORF type:complete len:241 (+),score=18.65 gnl/TRDRNA2_/TRDRNA2_133489_c1_seq1:62-724(+)
MDRNLMPRGPNRRPHQDNPLSGDIPKRMSKSSVPQPMRLGGSAARVAAVVAAAFAHGVYKPAWNKCLKSWLNLRGGAKISAAAAATASAMAVRPVTVQVKEEKGQVKEEKGQASLSDYCSSTASFWGSQGGQDFGTTVLGMSAMHRSPMSWGLTRQPQQSHPLSTPKQLNPPSRQGSMPNAGSGSESLHYVHLNALRRKVRGRSSLSDWSWDTKPVIQEE